MKIVNITAALIAMLPLAAYAAEITPQDLEDLPHADVVILGETHDNPIHHAHQLAAVQALAPSALVFEMLTPEVAPGTPLATADAAELAALFGPGWQAEFYLPILLAAQPDSLIYGAELPRSEVRRALAEGPEAVFGSDVQAYGLDMPLAADDLALREAEQQRAHCDALPVEILPQLVAGQRLRDAALARAVVQALAERTSAGPVVVITGSGHARKDRGIPVFLSRVVPDATVLSIGQIEGDAPPDAPYDLWLRTPPVVGRGDPCAAFEAAPKAAPAD